MLLKQGVEETSRMSLSIDFNTIVYIFLTLHTQYNVRLSSIKPLGFYVFWKFIFGFLVVILSLRYYTAMMCVLSFRL